MTIPTATATYIQIPGNGVGTVFAFPFKLMQSSDLLVGFVTTSGYSQQTSGFTVQNVDTNGGGTVTFTTAPPVGTTVDLRTQTAQIQNTEFANLGAYLPENTTEGLDRLTRMVQDAYRQTYTFGIHGPDTEATAWAALPAASVRANMALVFDANGLPVPGVLSSTPVTQQLISNLISATAFTASADAAAPIKVTQTYNYSGGTVGFVVPALNVTANVTACGNNFAWAVLARMNNSSTDSSQNVGLFSQGTSLVTAASPTWAAVFEGRDLSGSADPAKGRVSVEIDRRDAGTDANGNRVALDVVCTRPLVNGAFTGANATISYGVRVGSFGDIPSTTIGAGYTVANCNVGYAFDCANSTVSAGALRMANGKPILFDVSGGPTGTINSIQGNAGAGIDHRVSGVIANRLLQSGGLFMVGPSHTVVLNAATGASSGTAPVLTANKPGAATNIGAWISWTIDSVQFWVPAWAN